MWKFCYYCVLIVGVCLASSIADADEAKDTKEKSESLETAKALFKKGTDYFKAARYEEAADAFRAAYKEQPNWKLFYNIAQSEAAAKRHGRALSSFERYLALGGDDIDETRRIETENEIARLKKMIGYVNVDAPEGGTIIVDDVEYGVAPVAGGIPVSGSVLHVIRIALPDGTMLPSKNVSVVSGNKVSISFIEHEAASEEASNLGKTGESQESGVSNNEAELLEHKSSPWEIAGWATFGTGVGILAAAAVTGGLALSANSEVEKKCPDGCHEENYDLLDKRDTLGLTTNILLGVGGAVAVIGLVPAIIGHVKHRKERSDNQSFLFVPVRYSDGAGASIEVRF